MSTGLPENPVPAAADSVLVTEIRSPSESLDAWVVVDSLVDGIAMGGTRMTEGVTREEVQRLARAMTTKLALVGLPIGGAKAGIRGGTGPRDDVLRAFGRAVSPLLHGGVYLGCDLGTTHADRDFFFGAAKYDVRRLERVEHLPVDWGTLWTRLVDITGFGVCEAASTAVVARLADRPCRVAVQGFGTVGRAVAKGLESRGHRITAIADIAGTLIARDGLPVDKVLALTTREGTVDRGRLPDGVRATDDAEAWIESDVDLLVLAAAGDAIRADNAHRVRASVVVEGGNLCITAAGKEILASRGILVIPDVVANVGGAAVTGCVLTGTVPFSLPLGQMVSWFFDWVGARVRENTAAILEIDLGGAVDPVTPLLAHRGHVLGAGR